MTKRWFWAVALAAGVGLAGCGDDDDDDGAAAPPPAPGPTTCTPPTTPTATFSATVHPILTANCVPCHSTSYGSSDRAASYAAVQPRVNTTTPAQSELLRKGNGDVAHGGGDQLDPGEVTSITAWITECAQNN